MKGPSTSPQKFIKYEFVDESASIMSPTLTQERSPTPISPITEDSPAFTLLLEAANANPPTPNQMLTPPQSPDETDYKTVDAGNSNQS
jgi:hypothetical protein